MVLAREIPLDSRCKNTKIRFGPSGIQFFNRLSGLNVLLDEFVPPKTLWATAPRHVSIALTNACDLSCSYCFAPKNPASLNFDQIVAWLNELDANGTIGVGFGGGEPTLYPRFTELCSYAANHTRLSVSFTTHGHHLDDSLLNSLRGNVHFMRVSMDGVNETYERLRHRSFAILQERIAAVRQTVPFGINYVVNADTFRDIDAAIAIAERVGASEFLILPEQPVKGRAGITEPIADSLRHWIKLYSGPIRLVINERSSKNMPICNPFPDETGLRAYAHVDASGMLKPTSYHNNGVFIRYDGLMSALSQLEQSPNEHLL